MLRMLKFLQLIWSIILKINPTSWRTQIVNGTSKEDCNTNGLSQRFSKYKTNQFPSRNNKVPPRQKNSLTRNGWIRRCSTHLLILRLLHTSEKLLSANVYPVSEVENEVFDVHTGFKFVHHFDHRKWLSLFKEKKLSWTEVRVKRVHILSILSPSFCSIINSCDSVAVVSN